jgi:hypothetical protein
MIQSSQFLIALNPSSFILIPLDGPFAEQNKKSIDIIVRSKTRIMGLVNINGIHLYFSCVRGDNYF